MHFNQKVDNLPSGLKHLIINSRYFNQNIDNLPNGLEYLEIGFWYKQNITYLPNGLKYLEIWESQLYLLENIQNLLYLHNLIYIFIYKNRSCKKICCKLLKYVRHKNIREVLQDTSKWQNIEENNIYDYTLSTLIRVNEMNFMEK